uniref:Uncharacterized protein n=1 Tax=Nelumbo nucifera TaxID=4432 RepID=A0A822Z0G0_NELNU|nr:TPA_asm: hypothetical protein HUJ06_008888 [Nelumbo nucifera]
MNPIGYLRFYMVFKKKKILLYRLLKIGCGIGLVDMHGLPATVAKGRRGMAYPPHESLVCNLCGLGLPSGGTVKVQLGNCGRHLP